MALTLLSVPQVVNSVTGENALNTFELGDSLVTEARVLSDEVRVEISDPLHPEVSVRFDYSLDVDQKNPALSGVHLTGAGDNGEVDVQDFRELPMGRWEKAGRVAALEALDHERKERNEQALADLQAAADRGDFRAKRALTAMNRLLTVAVQYRDNVARGVPDPVAQIARTEGVKPATARTWVRRARQAGLIGPAFGPTAGERGPAARKSA